MATRIELYGQGKLHWSHLTLAERDQILKATTAEEDAARQPIASGIMKEFDPAAERHYPLFIVKAVEPGCTTEFQIENTLTGEVVRITTTDSEENDLQAIEEAVHKCLLDVWSRYEPKV